MAFKDGVRSRNTNWAKRSTPGNVMPNLSPLKGGSDPLAKRKAFRKTGGPTQSWAKGPFVHFTTKLANR